MIEVVEILPLAGEAPSLMESLAAMIAARFKQEERSFDRLRAHYQVERRLADRLRNAPDAAARRAIFATLYQELFREIPDHPRLRARDVSAAERSRGIRWDLRLLRPFLAPGCTFLEVGAGDCALSAQVAATAGTVYAVDISAQHAGALPPNARLAISDGTSIPVPEASVDVAFSDQLMEHLHPDDAREQLRNIHRALKPGGVYVCITPNRLYGPSDISGYFDHEARGLHLREYTLADLERIFREAGFRELRAYAGARGLFVRVPRALVLGLERLLEPLRPALRRRVASALPLRALLGLRVAAVR